MNSADLQSQLSAAFPGYRWIVEPLAKHPSVAATMGDRVVSVVVLPSSISIRISNESDGWEQCGWKDERSLEQILSILGSHLDWFAPIPKVAAIVRPKRGKAA